MVDIVYLDFTKALFTVLNKCLIYKIRSVGVEGLESTWIVNWLCEKFQRVVINLEIVWGCEWCVPGFCLWPTMESNLSQPTTF